MTGTTQFWLLIAALGAGTFLLRYLFFFVFGRYEVPGVVKTILPFIPASALSALVMPKVFGSCPSMATLLDPRVAAWVIAMIVAWRTRNIFLTIAGGMITLWSLHALL